MSISIELYSRSLQHKLVKTATAALVISLCLSFALMLTASSFETPRVIIVLLLGWSILICTDELREFSPSANPTRHVDEVLQIKARFYWILFGCLVLVGVGFIELYAPIIGFVTIIIGNSLQLKTKSNRILNQAMEANPQPAISNTPTAVMAMEAKVEIVAEIPELSDDAMVVTEPEAELSADVNLSSPIDAGGEATMSDEEMDGLL